MSFLTLHWIKRGSLEYLFYVYNSDSDTLHHQQIKWSTYDSKIQSVQFSSVAQLCPTLRLHGLQQTRYPCPSQKPRVYSNTCPLSRWCHPTIFPLSFHSPPAFNLSQHQGLFHWVSSSKVAKVLDFQLQHQSFQWIFRVGFL